MNRRGFLGLLATGAVGACVAARIPTALLPASVRSRAASEYLSAFYHRFSRAHGAPKSIYVGSDLWEAFIGELVVHQRFVTVHSTKGAPERDWLAFKSARVYRHGKGWDVMAPIPV